MRDEKPIHDAPVEFSRTVRVADLNPASGKSLSAKATADERAALARRFGVVAVPRLSFSARIRPWRDGWRVDGVVRARVTQSCVVTLEDVDQVLEEAFERTFSAGAAPDPLGTDIDPDGEDPPEPLGRSIDVGDIAAEAAALALDPWPRRDDASLPPGAADPSDVADPATPAVRPFDALAELRARMKSEGR